MNKEVAAYIAKFGQDAIDGTTGTNLFPSVKMAQAILESNIGKSELAKLHNNHFGIKKGIGWKGQIATMKTREVLKGKTVYVDAPFRKYASAVDSFRDHTNFLRNNKTYARNGVFAAATPEAQAHALKAAGYATDPNYAQALINLINGYGLKQLDAKKKDNKPLGQ